ncbi:MAG: hypothetical protein K2W82_18195 [Candidatus Obscuribacterales bacterium]|nr:hypothetical protein [Candidatus Obscuribacterales bacterium]
MSPLASRGMLVLLACLFLAACGCAETSEKQEAALAKPPALRIKVEPRQEGSGEKTRIHKFNVDDFEVETEIVYEADTGWGSKIQYWDENTGRLKEQKIILKDSSTVLTHYKLASDGKSIVWQEDYNHLTGKLYHRMERLSDGRFCSRFYEDGAVSIEIFERVTWNKNGSGNHEHVNKEHLNRESWTAEGAISEEQFKNGKLVSQSEFKNGSLTSTHYREDGTVHYKQYFRFPELRPDAAEHYRRFYPQHSPIFTEKVEVFSADGKKPLKTLLYSFFNGPYELQVPNDDGSYKIYDLKKLLGSGPIFVKTFDKNKKLLKDDVTSTSKVLPLLRDISSEKQSVLSPFYLDNLKRRFQLEE